ncbi:protein kinase C-binding protein 1-like isoform X2 [Zerene cesonia]|uniref:protein kinase C-binding protein 1-like isoform X2 n=1 Tax=Zerene cesonia TaxID=33412 RepID=UPI0018E4FF3B|nr:protein kinase C-binding protein 1-like isoform X2 [Zerene cesonia]
MEDNSDVNRETDVSSTTADVPESEEATRTKGNVEMVIVVEKMEIDSSSEESESPPIAATENENGLHIVSKEFPKKDGSPLKSKESSKMKPTPEKGTISPIKFVHSSKVVITPSKIEDIKQSLTTLEAQHNNLENSDNTVDSFHKALTSSQENVNDDDDEIESLDCSDGVPELTLRQSPQKLVSLPSQNSLSQEFLPETTPEDTLDKVLPQTTQNLSPVDSVPETTQSTEPVSETAQPAPIEQLENGDSQKFDESCKASLDSPCDKSNDSQLETGSDVSEKEHNKSISRELKSLIKSAKESKIISECTQLTSKTRKSRTCLDNSNSNLNTSLEAEKIGSVRRNSNMSSKSNCSEKSEKATKRSMRSQNPEFVNKVKLFLNSVTGKYPRESDDEQELESKKESETSPKKKKLGEVPQLSPAGEKKLRVDPYCWRCNWPVEQGSNEKGHPPMQCTVCPRSYHYKCLSTTERSKIDAERSWVCPECLSILHAESSDTRSLSMKKISLGLLCELLQHALARMMDLNGVEPFMQPVDRTAFPDYDKYVVHPMDLSLMKQNITNGLYGSTEAFMADAQWILHNSIIFNTCLNISVQSKLTGAARALVRLCRAEMGEIEACPECYAAAHARKPTWFTDVCSTPHVLLWAKLKGFPYWPAKGMSINNAGLVDVRFFGAHDRAWVPAKDCFLYSEKDPNNFRTKRQDILDSMQEAEQHIRSISRKYGKFIYPPFKTPFEPSKLPEQLKMMIPSFEGEIKVPSKEKGSTSSPKIKEKRRSNSKSSKSSVIDGETSENEETQTRKMADGAEIEKDEDFKLQIESDKSMENDETEIISTTRKRRRSDLEEAVITIIDSSSTDKQIDSGASTPKRSKVNGEVNTKTTDVVPGETSSIEKAEENGQDEKGEAPVEDKIEKTSIDSVQYNEVLPSSTTEKPVKEKSPVISTPIANSTPKRSSLKDKSEKPSPKPRASRVEKSSSSDKEKQEERIKHKIRVSRNKSLNNSKSEPNASKVTNKDANSNKNKDKKDKNSDTQKDKNTPKQDTPKSTKDRLQFDDDTSLAVIARDSPKDTNGTGMPTITSVRSLSTNQQDGFANNSNAKTIEVTIEPNSTASIFIPTSTDNVRNMKEAANKLQKLRDGSDVPVGRVGVRAFARMMSPEAQPKPTNSMEIEIKTEPLDVDDADRQTEKMDLMEACNLRPVNPPVNRLREVRINKVIVSPLSRKTASKPTEIRVKAKKTFPQPKKPDEGRSELNSKNSMVYIPIQPATTQAPVRPTRPVIVNGPTIHARSQASVSSVASSTINTVSSALVSSAIGSMVSLTSNTTTTTVIASSNTPKMTQLPTIQSLGSIPAIGQVPTNVHTVPLITSLNGQWTFSLQPMMSVGSVDSSSNTAIVNGIGDRTTAGTLVAVPTPASVASILPQLNSANNRTDDAVTELPRLQQRPLLNPFDSATPIGSVPPPSTAGPLTAKLNQNAVKLTDFFRTLLEDSLDKINEPAAVVTSLKLQLEQLQWKHKQEIDELKHNYELSLVEMRASFDKEKARVVSEARRNAQVELEAAVKATKTKQWCANCMQESQYYCCWNTSYCDYGCQRAHWPHHAALCTQPKSQDNGGQDSNSKDIHKRLQPAPDLPALQKNAPIPSLTVGGKVATRVFTTEQMHQKTSLIVSVMEDGSGNQTMKCVGTYKAPNPPNISPLIINKQIMNNEEAGAKKVTTSGGYLIVGSANAVNSPRRPHAIQYVHT